MITFLRNQFAGIPNGWITLWTKNSRTGESRTWWYDLQRPDWPEHLQADAVKADAAGWDCYYSTCPASKRKSSTTRITQKEITWLPALFMDVDTDATKAGAKVPLDMDAAIAALKALPYPPTTLVISGHGVHAYWKLAEPVQVTSAEDLQLVTKYLRGFADSSSRAMGYADLDTSASEPARVLRLPGTHNHKREPLPVSIYEMTGQTYALEDLAAWIKANADPPSESKQGTPGLVTSSRYELPAVMPQGARNNELYKYGCSLRSFGASDLDIETALIDANRQRCRPPLPDYEVRRTIASVNTKPPGNELRRKMTKQDNPPAGKTLADLRPENNERYNWTDIGNGRLFADWYKDVARFVPERKCWFIYNGKTWEPDLNDLAVMRLCKKLADALVRYAMTLPDEKIKMAYLDAVKRWQRRNYRETILKDARDSYPAKLNAFDAHPYLFNCQNGTLDLQSGEFYPHRASDLLSKLANVNYDPAAKSERWERFIDEVMLEDREKAAFLQKALGYALTGDTLHECFFILYGPTTRNGKGTAMETILHMMGDYGRSGQPATLAQKINPNSSAPSDDIARLAGARFVNFAEPDKKLNLSAALVKSLTGNDTITARYLNENSFEYKPQFKLFINTNHLPSVTDVTLFSSGRVKIIPFERHFAEWEQDTTLKKALTQTDNLSGILNWCIDGLRKIEADGFKPPAAVKAATDEYRKNSDRLGRFIEDEMEPGGEAPVTQVFTRYKWWCERNGYRAENMAVFKSSLENIAMVRKQRPQGSGREVNPVSLLLGYTLKPDIANLIPIDDKFVAFN